MIKQLKNRYNDPTMNKRFILGIDRAKMRLYDVEQVAQKDVWNSGQDEPVFDNTGVGKRLGENLMKSFPTSRYKKYKVKYYYDVEWRNKEILSMLLLNYQQMMLSSIQIQGRP